MLMNSYAPADDLDAALDRQKKDWLEGSRPTVSDLLRDSSLPSSHDVLLDLIYNEIVVREELGESPSLEEYIAQYPHLERDLRLHFEVHRAVQDELLASTFEDGLGASTRENSSQSGTPGSNLGGYEIVGELGRGGMGIVYRARHRRLKRFVAIKMIQPDRRPSTRELARFRCESEAIARLHHPNIVQIFEVGEENGSPYLALELAEGGTLQQRLQDLPYEPRAAAGLIEFLARALQHAHENHIVHCDLKPANVLFVGDGTPKITDFGLAKLLKREGDEPRDATRPGDPAGTPRYMSPEQASGQSGKVGPTTDVYGLGTLLYEAMTGRAPFVAPGVVETLDKIRNEEPLPPRRLQKNIPRDLETICLKCLQKDPVKRYHSARELAEDLERFLKSEPIEARRTPLLEQGWMWCKRHPAWATGIGAGSLVAASLLGFLVAWEISERSRIASLRTEIAALVNEGQMDLIQGNERVAKERFQAALSKVQAEPALRDHELGVRGWLDHSHRLSNNPIGSERQAPPRFEDRRDDAFVLALLSDPARPETVLAANEGIVNSLEFTTEGDPAWRLDREMLLILQADLAMRGKDSAKALTHLNGKETPSTRLGFLRRAQIRDTLQQTSEATTDRKKAEDLVPQIALESLFSGLKNAYSRNLDGAIRDFDQVLLEQPDHFLARLLQAICFLQAKRPQEAKVALTACIGQRPTFVWSHLCRAQANLQLGDMVASAQDLFTASQIRRNDTARDRIQETSLALREAIGKLSAPHQNDIWNSTITTEKGRLTLREVGFFHKTNGG